MQYRLNSEIEYHDPEEPFTSSCPLLPGQPVNVLDVPVQPPRTYSGNNSSDSLDSLVFTLDPRDKYLPPGVRRARTTSAIQQRKTLPKSPRMPLTKTRSDLLPVEDPPQTSNSTRDGPTLRPQRSLISIFDKLRRTKSAGSSTPRATTSWHRKVLSRAGSRAGLSAESSKKATPPEDIPTVPQVPAHILSGSKSNSANMSLPAAERPVACAPISHAASLIYATERLILSPEPNGPSNDEVAESFLNQEAQMRNEILNTSLQGKFGAPSKPRYVVQHAPVPEAREEDHSKPEDHYPEAPEVRVLPEGLIPSSVFHAAAAALRRSVSRDQVLGIGETTSAFYNEECGSTEHSNPAPGLNYANSSYATDESFSPNFASKSTQSGPMSPMQLSQPETPVMSDFGDDAVSWKRGSDSLDVDAAYMKPPSRAPPLPPPSQPPTFSNPFRVQAPLNGFQGYSIPQNEQGSTYTIKKPSSTTFDHPEHPLHRQTSSKNLVSYWNDGSEHRMTALEELVDDLGYLGAFIK